MLASLFIFSTPTIFTFGIYLFQFTPRSKYVTIPYRYIMINSLSRSHTSLAYAKFLGYAVFFFRSDSLQCVGIPLLWTLIRNHPSVAQKPSVRQTSVTAALRSLFHGVSSLPVQQKELKSGSKHRPLCFKDLRNGKRRWREGEEGRRGQGG